MVINRFWSRVHSINLYSNTPETMPLGSRDFFYNFIQGSPRNNFVSNPSLSSFEFLCRGDAYKALPAAKLCEIFDFSNFNLLIDIGGFPFIQAQEILRKHPHLDTLLTDADPHAITAVKTLEMLSTFNFATIDAGNAVDLELKSKLANDVVITAWGLDALLSDEELLKLFRLTDKYKSSLIMGTSLQGRWLEPGLSTVINRIKWEMSFLDLRVKSKFRSNTPNATLRARIRSLSYFSRLAKFSGISCTELLTCEESGYSILLFAN